jgi:cell division septation protein DedD
MSRLDIFTIVVVVVCVAAIVFLLYRTTDLFKGKQDPAEPQNTETLYEDDGSSGDDYTDDPYYSEGEGEESSEFDFLSEKGSEPAATATQPAAKPTEPEPATPRPAPVDVDKMSSVGGDYLVLAGAFTVMANAEAQALRLQKLGFSDAEVAIFNKGKYGTVMVGRFDSKSDANSLVSQLTDKGVEAYVHVKRSK